MKKILVFLLALVLLASVSLLPACSGEETSSPTPTPEDVTIQKAQGRLVVATTTSLYDSGLWAYLEPRFEQEYGVELDVLYAGTGKALEWGERGDVDAITVHSKARELAFVDAGYGVERIPFAYNYFLIVGPEADPAGISGLSPEDAFTMLMTDGNANQQIKFVSRGDDSGTHGTEKSVWAAAGYDYEDVRKAGSWYIEAGSGMGPTLAMASEMQAYTLTDIATFLSFKADLDLEPIVNEGETLINVYSVIVVANTKKVDSVNNLVNFLISSEIQELIGKYGVKDYGSQLFTPCAGQDR
ncbi:substrate-binding domain-containing protein [Chloroflexota bacterium]